MSFRKTAIADKYDLNFYDENGDHDSGSSSSSDDEAKKAEMRRYGESRGYSRPQYGDQYTERDVYVQPSTIMRSRPPIRNERTITGYDPNTSTWEQRVNNPAFYQALASNIYKLIGRDIIESELDLLRNYVMSVNYKLFTGMNDDKIIQTMAKGFVNKIHKSGKSHYTDVHEILRHEIHETGQTDQARTTFDRVNEKIKRIDPTTPSVHIGSILGHQSPYDILNLFNPGALITTQRIELDSRYRQVSSSLNNKIYTWGILYDVQRALGHINIVGSKITNIVEFRLFPIRMPVPRIASAVSGKQYRLLIREWATQAFASPNGKAFHCVFRPTTDGDFIDLDPVGDVDQGGRFAFDKKITRLDEVSISFTDPYEDIEFHPDRFICNITTYGANTSFTSTANLPTLTTGDLVRFDGMYTTDTTIDSVIINAINSTQYAITVTGATTFDITGLDTSVIDIARRIGTLGLNCYVEKRRFSILMEVKYLAPEAEYP